MDNRLNSYDLTSEIVNETIFETPSDTITRPIRMFQAIKKI
jgi:hypothetical protein